MSALISAYVIAASASGSEAPPCRNPAAADAVLPNAAAAIHEPAL
jgi:hypothetical protein